MLNNDRFRDDFEPFEDALRTLTPGAARINRDALMFHAGKTAGTQARARSVALWRGTTACATLAAVLLAVAGAVRNPAPAPRTAGASSPDPLTTADQRVPPAPVRFGPDRVARSLPWRSTPRNDGPIYVLLRNRVLADGTDALPSPAAAAAVPVPRAFGSIVRPAVGIADRASRPVPEQGDIL